MKSFPDELELRFTSQSSLARAAVRHLSSPTRHLDAFQRWTMAAQIASDLSQWYTRRSTGQGMAREWSATHLYASAQAGHAYAVLQGQEREITMHGDYLSPEESAEYREREAQRRIASDAALVLLAQNG